MTFWLVACFVVLIGTGSMMKLLFLCIAVQHEFPGKKHGERYVYEWEYM